MEIKQTGGKKIRESGGKNECRRREGGEKKVR